MNATQKPRNRYKAMWEEEQAESARLRKEGKKLAHDATYNSWFGAACGVAFCVAWLGIGYLAGSFL